METQGVFAPATVAEARERYAAVGPAAQTVVKETARAMAFDAEEYDERVTGEVIETARDALFASLLEVHTGTRAEFNDWLADADYDGADDEAVTLLGSESVEGVAWHDAGFTDEVVAATYQAEPAAATATLRRNAFGRVYVDRLVSRGSSQRK